MMRTCQNPASEGDDDMVPLQSQQYLIHEAEPKPEPYEIGPVSISFSLEPVFSEPRLALT